MTSKWIKEVKDVFTIGFYLDDIFKILERIDKLLRLAMNSTDNEELHDKIREEIENVQEN